MAKARKLKRGRTNQETVSSQITQDIFADKGLGAETEERSESEKENEEEYFHARRLFDAGEFRDDWLSDEGEVLGKVANRTYFTVVVYDIADDKRRNQLAKLLLGYGDRVQYSGFEGHLSAKQLDRLSAKIKQSIDEAVDKVRIYKISGDPQVTIFGCVPLVTKEDFTII
jgi:CRISPR-associated protein Cas2